MTKVIKRKICSTCASEKDSEYCQFCGKETPSNISINISEKIKLKGLFQIKFRELGKKVRSIIRSGWKQSGDPLLKEGVYEDRIIDRNKDEYHQVIKDVRTGKILHEEHEKLSEHKSK